MPPFDPPSSIVASSQDKAELVRLVREGNLLNAIKLYRQLTLKDLKASKDFVEWLAQQLKGGSFDSASLQLNRTVEPVRSEPAPLPNTTEGTAKQGFGCGAILFAFLLGAAGTLLLASAFPQTLVGIHRFLFNP